MADTPFVVTVGNSLRSGLRCTRAAVAVTNDATNIQGNPDTNRDHFINPANGSRETYSSPVVSCTSAASSTVLVKEV